MTEQEINKKIAEYMGFDVRLFTGNHMGKEILAYLVYENLAGHDIPRGHVPDYCHDLNAVWQVEEKLIQEDLIDDYTLDLYHANIKKYPLTTRSFTGKSSHVIHATARQKCEAIVKVLEGLE
jgi:hypothetical protein